MQISVCTNDTLFKNWISANRLSSYNIKGFQTKSNRFSQSKIELSECRNLRLVLVTSFLVPCSGQTSNIRRSMHGNLSYQGFSWLRHESHKQTQLIFENINASSCKRCENLCWGWTLMIFKRTLLCSSIGRASTISVSQNLKYNNTWCIRKLVSERSKR